MNVVRRLRHPVFWLLLQSACLFLLLEVSGSLEPQPVADTVGYELTSYAESVSQALTGYRTFGYPLFMKSLGAENVPRAQALLFLAAILLLWYSVRVYTGSGWLAFVFATPLYYTTIWGIVARVQPDFLAAALALGSLSLLLLVASRPRGRLLWIALTLCVFATYQVRPAYVFLVALIPVMGAVLRFAYEHRGLARSLILGMSLLGVTALPLLSFSALRLTLVGDFGLVPFGGYNLIGVTASLLDQSLVDGLSRNQALAEDILRDRERRNWLPVALGDDTRIWQDQHNSNVWLIAVEHATSRLRAARTRDGFRDRSTPHIRIATNRVFKQLSWDIIRKRPWLYAQWVRDTFLQTLALTFEDPGIRWPGILIALSLPIGALLKRTDPVRTGSGTNRGPDRTLALLGLLALGIAFFVVHATTVALVNLPAPRFFYAMSLLLPSVLCGVLFEIWRSIAAAARRRGADDIVIASALALGAALVLVPAATRLYRGAVARTTVEAASSWIERNARFLDHRTIASEIALEVGARSLRRRLVVPLELAAHELSELSRASLDLSDYEVFPQSRLEGPHRDFYRSRIERLGAAGVLSFEPRVFRRVGPALVVLSHPWRVYGGRAQGNVETSHPVSWRRRKKRRLRTALPGRFQAGQVISLDIALTAEQARDCELELGGEKVEPYPYRPGRQVPFYMTPRMVLTEEGSGLSFECPDRALMSPEPAVSVIRWLPATAAPPALG